MVSVQMMGNVPAGRGTLLGLHMLCGHNKGPWGHICVPILSVIFLFLFLSPQQAQTTPKGVEI